jgi:hypothetical protein
VSGKDGSSAIVELPAIISLKALDVAAEFSANEGME